MKRFFVVQMLMYIGMFFVVSVVIAQEDGASKRHSIVVLNKYRDGYERIKLEDNGNYGGNNVGLDIFGGDTILVPAKSIKLPNVELLDETLDGEKIYYREIKNANFNKAVFRNVLMNPTRFKNCTFRDAVFLEVSFCEMDPAFDVRNTGIDSSRYSSQKLEPHGIPEPRRQGRIASFINCDMTGATIHIEGYDKVYEMGDINALKHITDISFRQNIFNLSYESLKQTRSFKLRDLSGWVGGIEANLDHVNLDLSGFKLIGTYFYRLPKNTNVENARIRYSSFEPDLSVEQLRSTYDFKQGTVIGVRFKGSDFSKVNFAKMNLSGCYFVSCNFSQADFTDTVITDCNFSWCKITEEQLQSTWNYKNNRMEGIKYSIVKPGHKL
jgi:uncharacterized protein YjbI with pentapeptide repeats